MNERGEAIVLSILILTLLTGLLSLCGLELQHSFGLMRKRSEIFLCTKELKGELHQHLKVMGQTNWGLKNIKKAQLLSAFIPGIQGVALSGEKLKKMLKGIQTTSLIHFLSVITTLNKRHCPVPVNAYQGAFQFDGVRLKRGLQGEALLRNKKWIYLFYHHPYLLEVRINAIRINELQPQIKYSITEKKVKSFSLSSSL
jgi:hypothetical protein